MMKPTCTAIPIVLDDATSQRVNLMIVTLAELIVMAIEALS